MTDPIRKSPEGLTPAEHLDPIDQNNKDYLQPTEDENKEVVSTPQEEGQSSSAEETEQQVVDEAPTSVESVLDTQAVLEPVSASDAQDKIMTEHLLKDSAGLDNADAAHKLLLDIMNPEA